jgi:hypothetical protein
LTCAETIENCLTNLEKYNHSEIVIMGDLNGRFGNLNQINEENSTFDNFYVAKDRSTNDHTTNKRGQLLCEVFELYGYVLLNGRTQNDSPAKFTYVGKNGKSVVDVAWVNLQALTKTTNFEINYSGSVSDHLPCIINLKFPGNNRKNIIKQSQKFTKLKWNTNKLNDYSNRISEIYKDTTLNHNSIQLLSKFREVAVECGMQKTIVTSDSNSTAMKNPWFNNECKILKSELNKAARKFKTN